MSKPSAPGDLVCVIMAGGAGTRLWPASTEARPKQFLPLMGQRSLLQRAYERVVGAVGPERVLVLTSARFVPLVREQLSDLPAENVLGEPLRRDTAAAVALAVALAEHRFGDPVMAVLTSDHLIEPMATFQANLASAASGAASSSALYTFGIPPDYPATGFGYLELGAPVPRDGDPDPVEHAELERFVEKPDAATAEGYLKSGRFLWNSGMFVWRTSSIAAELERQLPKHLELLRPAVRRDDLDAALREAFEPLDKVSIDFGVMEHAKAVRCVKATFQWSDVGGFNQLAEHIDVDDDGNQTLGARVVSLDAMSNLVLGDDPDELVTLLGVEDLIVVRAGKRTLVARRDRDQDIKQLVAMLDADDR